jgi:hypothetical protein
MRTKNAINKLNKAGVEMVETQAGRFEGTHGSRKVIVHTGDPDTVSMIRVVSTATEADYTSGFFWKTIPQTLRALGVGR